MSVNTTLAYFCLALLDFIFIEFMAIYPVAWHSQCVPGELYWIRNSTNNASWYFPWLEFHLHWRQQPFSYLIAHVVFCDGTGPFYFRRVLWALLTVFFCQDKFWERAFVVYILCNSFSRFLVCIWAIFVVADNYSLISIKCMRENNLWSPWAVFIDHDTLL